MLPSKNLSDWFLQLTAKFIQPKIVMLSLYSLRFRSFLWFTNDLKKQIHFGAAKLYLFIIRVENMMRAGK